MNKWCSFIAQRFIFLEEELGNTNGQADFNKRIFSRNVNYISDYFQVLQYKLQLRSG